MFKIVILAFIIQAVWTITFPLSSTKETCLYIKQQGAHSLQFIVSGQQPTQYTCTIYSDDNLIDSISLVTEYEKEINFLSSNNKICFSPLDNELKQVSFDIISKVDPLKEHFQVKDQEQTHLKMFNAFLELEKVYSDQNMFIERSTIYGNIIGNREVKILFILVFKTAVAILLGGYQLLMIKQLLTSRTHQYYPPQAQDNDSQDEMQ